MMAPPAQATVPAAPPGVPGIAGGGARAGIAGDRAQASHGGAPRAAAPRPPRAIALLVFLAARGLRESRLSTALLLAAIAAGVAFQIPNTANLDGYRAELLDQGLASGLGDVRIRPRHGDRFENGLAVAARARAVPGVTDAQPILILPGAVGHGGHFNMLSVWAADAGAEHHPYILDAGSDLDAKDNEGVLLGSLLAKRLGVGIGDTVDLRLLLSTGPRLGLDGDALGRYEAHVRGLVSGTFGASEGAYVLRSFAASEVGVDDAASIVAVHGDHGDAAALALAVARVLPDATVVAWADDSAYLRHSVRASDALRTVSQAMMLLGVGIPVLGLLYVSALHRRRQIALLSAMGFSRGDVFAVFFLQALLVAIIGAASGTAFGWLLLTYFRAHPIFAWENFVIRPTTSAAALVRPAAAVIAVALLAGVHPALRAARADPASILRGNE